MWIDHYIWHHAVFSIRHVFMANEHSNNSLLSVPRCKLVTDFWNTHVPDSYFIHLAALLGLRHYNSINDTYFGRPYTNACISSIRSLYLKLLVLLHEPWRACSPDQ